MLNEASKNNPSEKSHESFFSKGKKKKGWPKRVYTAVSDKI